jgi:hypothetical protein
MTCKSLLAALAACAAAAVAGVPVAGDILMAKAHAQSAQPASKARPVTGRSIELRRGGYYSYGVPEGARRSNMHLAPMVDLQSPAGPFDSGFFFDSGLSPHWWNNSPYPN